MVLFCVSSYCKQFKDLSFSCPKDYNFCFSHTIHTLCLILNRNPEQSHCVKCTRPAFLVKQKVIQWESALPPFMATQTHTASPPTLLITQAGETVQQDTDGPVKGAWYPNTTPDSVQNLRLVEHMCEFPYCRTSRRSSLTGFLLCRAFQSFKYLFPWFRNFFINKVTNLLIAYWIKGEHANLWQQWIQMKTSMHILRQLYLSSTFFFSWNSIDLLTAAFLESRR